MNRKPECQATAMVEVRALEWNGQEMTAMARDLAASSIKKPVVDQLDWSERISSHPCVCCLALASPTYPY